MIEWYFHLQAGPQPFLLSAKTVPLEARLDKLDTESSPLYIHLAPSTIELGISNWRWRHYISTNGP